MAEGMSLAEQKEIERIAFDPLRKALVECEIRIKEAYSRLQAANIDRSARIEAGYHRRKEELDEFYRENQVFREWFRVHGRLELIQASKPPVERLFSFGGPFGPDHDVATCNSCTKVSAILAPHRPWKGWAL